MPGYGMTLQEKHKIDLAKSLMDQLGATEEVLKKWEKEDYPADGQVVSKFWGQIGSAPAVAVIGDYDVDGICASYVMDSSIREIYPDKDVFVRIPKRFSEGYGINEKITQEIREKLPKGSVVITVDNGIAAAPILEGLEADGYVVLMTDHHELREGCQVPNVTMTIDPAVKDIPNPLEGRYWCGAAVAYKLCEPMISEDLSKELSIYAGLATVADCMVLKEGNWGIVRNAIKAFRRGKAPEALSDLLIAMKQDPKFCNEDHFGFYLGPAFNAPGRLLDDGAMHVFEYLKDPSEERCQEIWTLNEQRKTLKEEEYEMIRQKIMDEGLSQQCPIWVECDGLHEGIVGILAGKVAEEFKVPAIVMTKTEGGFLKGSARSAGSFDVFKYLSGMSELFMKMGGHPGAAGLSMTKENFDKAKLHQIPFSEISELTQDQGIVMKIRSWEIPGLNTVLGKFRPFGEGNQVPKFEVEVNFSADGAKMFGKEGNKVHLGIEDSYGRWRVNHFFHIPNDLSNKEHFGLIGTIAGASKFGREIPTFNADEAFDIEEENQSREENIHS